MAQRDAAAAESRRRFVPGGAKEPRAGDVASFPPPRLRIAITEPLAETALEARYQPKINLKRKCLAGAEAFTHIRHPQLGPLAPGDFECVTAANIALLTEHALVDALRSWPLFDQAGFNLSFALEARIGTLLARPIRELLAAHRPKAPRWPGLIVHVNEDEVVRDVTHAREMAIRLGESGVRLSIDRFGAGYSSLASLRDIPFVEIRLDPSFVQDCATDPVNRAICQTAIDLAHRFGAAAAADGVKSAADLQALMTMGCDVGQGELIAPPLTRAEFLALLREPMSKLRQAPAAPAVIPIDRIA
jgi:EAL domain-containing protein (putative c-di-GMP-specific phosphodiesterase class I)